MNDKISPVDAQLMAELEELERHNKRKDSDQQKFEDFWFGLPRQIERLQEKIRPFDSRMTAKEKLMFLGKELSDISDEAYIIAGEMGDGS